MALARKQRKTDALLALEQLEMRASLLEKEKSAHLYSKRSEFRSEFCQLEETDLKLVEERKQERQKLRQQINRVRTNVGKFQRSLKSAKPNQQFVQKLKELMEEIESSITAFKNQQRENYDSLSKEEKVASQEISAFDKRIESWTLMSTSAPPTQAAKTGDGGTKSHTETEYPPAIADFERFLQQTGGHQGGWDDYDHQTFLKIYRAHHSKGKPFLDEAVRSLPGRSERDVVEHEQWYREYLALKDRRKEAIRVWREQKESEKAEALAGVEKERDEAEDAEAERQKAEAARKEREMTAAKLAQWKAEQEMKRLAEEEKMLKERLARAEDEAKKRKRKAAVKAKVEEYARQKGEEKEILKAADEALAKEEIKRRRAANRQLERFQLRDVAALEEKKVKQIEQEIEKEHQAMRLERLKGQVDVKVHRDPSRLYKLTEGWENRKKDAGGSSNSASRGPITSVPKRAVPSWRKGI
ncbi:coiled-coil domain-containing protein 112-like isoform X1 [Oscarella lobularis]|uniref:coiled-coil domain-containing protein 112-like isoform X1 n=1 Tax=Oscarella lobularis TaxID=121494 RepID=UPI003313CF79